MCSRVLVTVAARIAHDQYGGGWQLQQGWSPPLKVTDASIFQPDWMNAFKDDVPVAQPAYDPALSMQGYVAPDAYVGPAPVPP